MVVTKRRHAEFFFKNFQKNEMRKNINFNKMNALLKKNIFNCKIGLN